MASLAEWWIWLLVASVAAFWFGSIFGVVASHARQGSGGGALAGIVAVLSMIAFTASSPLFVMAAAYKVIHG